MEKAAFTDAFYENFGTGLWLTNTFLDQHGTWAADFYRQDNYQNGNNGADFADGKYAMTGRLTALPIYTDDGTCFLHLGASCTWRKCEDPNPGVSGPATVRFRARPELRDAIGDFGSTVNNITLPGNASRLVDTGAFNADSQTIIGTELLGVYGPFSVQGEWAFGQANDSTFNGKKVGTASFNGGYVEATYFLTGEHRTYDRRFGKIATNYFAGPTTPFWLTRREEGGWTSGSGAWEIAARYSYLNLNDGPISGGVMGGVTLGVNWYLNQNLKVLFNWVDDNRWDFKGQPGAAVQGFGTRVVFQF
jgi:phosphate-selective porin OprO/OprP